MDPPAGNEKPPWSTSEVSAQEIDQDGSDGIDALPQRLHRYELAHRRSLLMSEYLASLDRRYESRLLAGCGSWLWFRWYHEVDVLRLHSAPFCKRHLICPLCAIRRASKMLQAYLERIAALNLEVPDLRPYLVTVTVKNGPDPAGRFDHLTSAVRHMLQQRRAVLSGSGRGQSSLSVAVGGAGSYEVKMGANSGEPHPHAHMVLLCDDEPLEASVRRDLYLATGDSFIADVRPITTEDGLIGGLCEVFKYAMKFGDMCVEDNLMWADHLRARRLIFSFGKLWGITIPEDLTDFASALLDDEPYIDMIYRFVLSAGYEIDSFAAGSPAKRAPFKGPHFKPFQGLPRSERSSQGS